MGEVRSGTRATTRRSAKAAVLAVFFAAAALLGSSFAASPASASESAIGGPDGDIYVIESGDTSSVLKSYDPSTGNTSPPIPVNPTKPTDWFKNSTEAQIWNDGLAGRLTTGQGYDETLSGTNRIFTNDTRAQNNDPAVKDIFVADDGTIYIFEDLYEGLTVGYYPRDTVYRRSDDDTKLLTVYVCDVANNSTDACRGSSDPRYLADPKNAGIFNSSGVFQTNTAKNLYRSYPQFWSDEYIGSEYFPTRNIPSLNSTHFSISSGSDEYELPCSGYDNNRGGNAASGTAISCTGLSGNSISTTILPNTKFSTINGLSFNIGLQETYWRPYKLIDEFQNGTDENACAMYFKVKRSYSGGYDANDFKTAGAAELYFGFRDTSNTITSTNAQYANTNQIYNKMIGSNPPGYYNIGNNADLELRALKYIFSVQQSSDGANDLSATQIGEGGLTDAELKALPNNDNSDYDNTLRIPFNTLVSNSVYGASRDLDIRSGDVLNTNPPAEKSLTYALHGYNFYGGEQEAGWYRLIGGYDRFDRNIYPRNDYYMARGRVLIGTLSGGSYTWAAEEVDLSGFGPSPTPYVTDAAFDNDGNLYVLATFYSHYYSATGVNNTSWLAMKKLLDNTGRERTFMSLEGVLTTYGPGNTISASDRGSLYPSPDNSSGTDTLANSYKGIHDMICTNVSGDDKGKGQRVVMKLTKQANGYSTLTGSELMNDPSTKSLDDIIWETAIIDDASIASHENTNNWMPTSIALSTDSSDGTSDKMFVATQSEVKDYGLDGNAAGATFNLKSVLNTNKAVLHSSCNFDTNGDGNINLGDYNPYRIRSLEADDHVVSVHFSKNGQSGASSVILLSKEDLSPLKFDNGTPNDDTDDKIQVYGECGDGAANYPMAAKHPSDTGNNNDNLEAVNLAIKTRIDRTDGAATYGDLELLYFGDDSPSGAFTKKRLIEELIEAPAESNLDGSSFIVLPYDNSPSPANVTALIDQVEGFSGVGADEITGMWSFRDGGWTTYDVDQAVIAGPVLPLSIVVFRMSSPEKAKAALSNGLSTLKDYYNSASLNNTKLTGGWNILYCSAGSASPTMGIDVPEADGRGVLGVFAWGKNQNPNTWTHIALPLSTDTNLPDGYIDLTSIEAETIAAVYLDLNEAAKSNEYAATC